MKSERRHDLEKNILADRLSGGIEASRPVLPFVFGGIAILVVASLGWGIYSASARSKSATAWTEFYFNLTSSNADAFVDVAETYPNSDAAQWAQLNAGNVYLERGIEALYLNRAEGEKLLNQAIEAFDAATTTSLSELNNRAHFGIARAHEALGQLDEATEHYEAVVDSDAYPSLIDSAKQRIAFISSPSGRSFYAWFNTLDPKPNAPIQLPSNLSVPPTSPGDLKFDSLTNPSTFDIPQSAADNPNAPPQTVEPDPSTPLPGSLDVDNAPTAESPDAPAEAGSNLELPATEPPASDESTPSVSDQ